jgi:hypothetical protein
MTTLTLPQIQGSNLLTHSRMSCFQSCPRKHYYRYVLGWTKDRESTPLRIGSAYHEALDLMAKGKTMDEAFDAIKHMYSELPGWVKTEDDLREWTYEMVTVIELINAYAWYYANDDTIVEYVASETSFRLPLVNPATGWQSTSKQIAGKIDKIVKLRDGRKAVMEHKTTSDDLGPDSDYWPRLRIDHQISRYIIAAREQGHDVQTVIYDVTRKPQIKPTAIALTDDEGIKIVLDASGQRARTKDGKKWRETADKDQGLVLQTRPMTPEEWGEKLRADIQDRPGRYFQRREIPRLESDLQEYRHDAWNTHQLILQCERTSYYPRNTAACINPYKCEFFEPCTGGHDSIDPPEGFKRAENLHPEL